MNLSADAVITQLVNAPSDADALDILKRVNSRLVREIADLLWIDSTSSTLGIRRAIVREVRS
jgi:hypothetical protein